MKFNSGKKIKATTPQGEAYFAFQPELINKEFSWDDKRIDTLLESADRKSTRLNSSHSRRSRMPSSA